MNVVIYSKPDCNYCNLAKELLRQQGIPFGENIIGQDIIREEFVSMYPAVRTVPHIIIDGVELGGYTELKNWISQRPQLLEG